VIRAFNTRECVGLAILNAWQEQDFGAEVVVRVLTRPVAEPPVEVELIPTRQAENIAALGTVVESTEAALTEPS
jgi:hypothetical protein